MRQKKSNRNLDFSFKESFLAIAIFLFFFIIFFHSLIAQKSFIGGDFLTGFGIFYNVFFDLKEFSIFNWHPYSFSGIPSMSAFFYAYLPNWPVIFLMNNEINYSYYLLELTLIFNIFLSAVFTYLLARYFHIGFFGAIISGLIFSLSGCLIAKMSFISMVFSIVWLPIIFLFFHRGLNRNNFRDIIIAGFFLIMSGLGSHLQITYYIGLFLFFYTVFFAFADYRKNLSGASKKGAVFAFAAPFIKLISAAIVLTGGLMIIILPLLNYINYTWHGNIAGSSGCFLPPAYFLFTQFFPQYFGGMHLLDAFHANWNAAELSTYVGTTPLVLSGISIFILFKKNAEIRFLSIAALISLLISFGVYSPLYQFLFSLLPLFNNFTNPARFALFFIMSVSLLSGFGFDAIAGQGDGKIERNIRLYVNSVLKILLGVSFSILFIAILYESGIFIKEIPFIWLDAVPFSVFIFYYLIFTLIVLINYLIINKWFSGKIKKPILAAVLVLALFLDLFLLGPRAYDAKEIVNPEKFYEETPIVSFLNNQNKSDYRVLDQNFLNDGYDNFHKIFSVGGLGVASLRYENYTKGNFYEASGYAKITSGNRLNLLNARYALFKAEPEEGNYKKIPGIDNLYENLDALPRLFIVHKAETIGKAEEVLSKIDSDDFNPSQTVILEKASPLKAINGDDSGGNRDMAEFTYYSPDKIDIYIYSDNPGMLFLSEIYYPGWMAYVDGKPVEIYQADYLFRSIYLEKGPHAVRMVFDPADFKLGRNITVLTLTVLLIYFVVGIIRNRKFEGLI